MEVYIVLYSIIILASFESFRFKHKSELYWPVAFLIICFAAFRGNGFDWESYQNIYNNIFNGGEQSGGTFVEYGYVLFCKISPTYKFLVFLCAVCSISVTFAAIYKFSKSYLPVLGLLIFSTTLLLPTYMGQIRQGLAMGFVCLAVYDNYIKEKRKALLWIIVACCFHVSAILACIIFIVPSKKLKIRTYLFIILASLALYGVSQVFMSFIMNLSSIGPIQKLLYYSMTEKEEVGITSTVLIRMATFIVASIVNRKGDKKIAYLCNIYLCGIVVYLLFGFLPQLGIRGCLYFMIYDMVLVPYILYQFRKNALVFITGYLSVIGLSIIRIVSFFGKDLNHISYIPYLLY